MLKLSCLSKKILDEYKYFLSKTPIEYRMSLDLPAYALFGHEVEVMGVEQSTVRSIISNLNNNNHLLYSGFSNFKNRKYKIDFDYTVDAEPITPPLQDNENTWLSYEKFLSLIRLTGAYVTDNVDGHIHASTNIFKNPRQVITFLKMSLIFSNVYMRYGYGFENKPRINLLRYERKINGTHLINKNYLIETIKLLEENSDDKDKFNKILDRYLKLYFQYPTIVLNKKENQRLEHLWESKINRFTNYAYNNTIEFRFFNDTLDKIIGQNNINFALKWLVSIGEDKIDPDYIDYLYEQYIESPSSQFDYNNCKEYNDRLHTFKNEDEQRLLLFTDMIATSETDQNSIMKIGLKLFTPEEKARQYVNQQKVS